MIGIEDARRVIEMRTKRRMGRLLPQPPPSYPSSSKNYVSNSGIGTHARSLSAHTPPIKTSNPSPDPPTQAVLYDAVPARGREAKLEIQNSRG